MRTLFVAAILAVAMAHPALASVHPAPLPPLAASPLGILAAAGFALRRKVRKG